ncbi:MAG: Fur family transcriptional regulator [bacterium]|nr:Fur family transcriptional regulator [bacterium]
MENLIQTLKKQKIKLTKPREHVLGVLSRTHHPISAQAIFQEIKKIDLASVYRTLSLLEKLSLVHIEVINQEKLYCLETRPHHHIICQNCGYTKSFDCEHLFNKVKNFTNIKHQLTLTGLCEKCGVSSPPK